MGGERPIGWTEGHLLTCELLADTQQEETTAVPLCTERGNRTGARTLSGPVKPSKKNFPLVWYQVGPEVVEPAQSADRLTERNQINVTGVCFTIRIASSRTVMARSPQNRLVPSSGPQSVPSGV